MKLMMQNPKKTLVAFFAVLGLIAHALPTLADTNNHVYFKKNWLEQNWTEQDRQYFYFAEQGSRLIPYDYFLHLEQADKNLPFRSDENMLRFGLIPAEKSPQNPDGLPIGFARNLSHQQAYMGPTCAACHTQQIQYKNQTIMIDGGQTLFDLQKFLSALTLAMKATLENSEKLARFQQSVLGVVATAKQKEQLKSDLKTQFEKRKAYSIENHTDAVYGYARLDAFGAILNRALVATGEKNNTNPPNAPTSFPYLWDTPQHDYVEWNGSQANSNVGAFARNIGQVIGVFGEVETKKTHWLGLFDGGYTSSINTTELRALEKMVGKLHSPLWPAQLPKINMSVAKQGRVLYEKHCIACHVDINRTDPKRMIQVRMSTLGAVKTDPLMAQNAITRQGKSGKFEGQPRYYVAGKPLPKIAPALDIANNLMVGVIKNNPWQAYFAQRDATKFGHTEAIHPPKYVDGSIIESGQEVSQKALLAYKARPLNGVWSSAPFLHNGSVPNLYQLLIAPKDRVKQFYLGAREFDPKQVGYEMTQVNEAFLFDTTLPGNSNAGHEYGTGYGTLPALTEDERWALIEYIKTL